MGLRTGRTLVLALLAAAVLASAARAQVPALRRQSREAPPERRSLEKTFPFGVTWVLRSVNGKPVTAADPPSFSIDATLRGRGFGGCNSFSMALYPIRDQQLASGAIATTHKICAPGVMAAERSFMVALHSLPKWTATPEGSSLVLRAQQAVLSFARGI